MNLNYSDEENAFRLEVRSFIAAHLPNRFDMPRR